MYLPNTPPPGTWQEKFFVATYRETQPLCFRRANDGQILRLFAIVLTELRKTKLKAREGRFMGVA